MSDPELQFLDVGQADSTRAIAIRMRHGAGPPLVWLGGFRSDMRATKASALDAWGAQAGRAVVRFDYSGHGESGGDFADGTILRWLEEALAVIAETVGEPPVLVGSSMGGWIALLAARALRASAIAPCGLVLIAPAVDFTEELIWDALPQAARDQIMSEGVWMRASAYAPDPYPITRALIEDGRRHLLLGSEIETGCPVHILQGRHDPDVPYTHALALLQRLTRDPVSFSLVPDGDHRLSRPQDIALLLRAVESLPQA